MGVNGIYGLSGSGIDVESMVKVGMISKQKEYDKMQQTFTKDQWQKQAYNEIYGNLQTFSNSTLTQYKLQSNMNAKSATTTSSAITVSANGAAPIINHKIQVNELSSTAYLVSTNKLHRYYADNNTDTTDQTSINMADVLFKGLQKNTSGSTTMANVTEIDGTSSGLHNSTDVAFSLQISDGTTKADGTLKYSTIKYTYGQLLDGRTFNDLVSDINGLNLNVRASYDATNDTFNFYNKEGGSANGVFFNIPTKTTTDEDGNTTTSYTEAGERAKNFLQGLHLYQSKEGTLINQNGEIVTDTSDDRYYLGYESTYATASLVASKALVDADGDEASAGTSIKDLLFQNITLGEELAFESDELDNNGNPLYDYFYKVTVTNADGTTTEALSSDTAMSFTINVDGEDYEYAYTYEDLLRTDATQITFTDLLNDIYDETGLNAYMSEDGYLTIGTEASGKDQSFSITSNNDTTSEFLSRLGLYDGTDSNKTALTFTTGETQTLNGIGGEESSGFPIGVTGTNGEAIIDGVTYSDITTNKVTAAGVTYTLLEKTDEAVTVNVVQDTQGIIDKVKSFVEDYNKLLSGLYEKYDEKQYSDYKPLTESQKEQMKDEQIEKWEEKAKSGMLYHDQTLNKVIYKIRDAISTPISGLSGKYDSIFSLGIKTTGLKGQLTLDEDKLKAALEEDPDSVYNIFGTIGKDDTFEQNGVAQRLGDMLNDGMKLVKSRAGTDDGISDDSELGVLMRNLQTRMSDFKKLMDSFEDKLYKKYDAMEVALSRLGMQLGYITGGQ
ncbi:MAG: flagellar filament capping protein FliD [Selenomonadaceae bacterium]|nr:flagellar filament capping protein FliD [Selenomonadaceae bacterium]